MKLASNIAYAVATVLLLAGTICILVQQYFTSGGSGSRSVPVRRWRRREQVLVLTAVVLGVAGYVLSRL